MRKSWIMFALLTLSTVGAFCNQAAGAFVSHWKLDDVSGPATDSAGPNNGVLGGGITQGAAGQIGTAYLFSGAGGVDVADSVSLKPTSFTISAWVNTTDTGPFRGVVDKIESGVGGYAIDVNSGVTRFMLTGSFVEIAGPTVNDGQWHMLTGTYDAGTTTMEFYVDGVSQGTQTTAMTHTTQDLFFGGDNISTFLLSGRIDDIGLWDEALSGSRIVEIYNFGLEGLDLTTVPVAPEPGMLGMMSGLALALHVVRARCRLSRAALPV